MRALKVYSIDSNMNRLANSKSFYEWSTLVKRTTIIYGRKYWSFPENRLNLQFELVRWRRAFDDISIDQKDWVLGYW